MDKYGVQNGNWRKQETEITTIKRIIYTKNKTWKKEFEGGKLSINKISTTSNKEPEKKKPKPTHTTQNINKEINEIECVFNSKQKKGEKEKTPKHTTQKPKTKDKTTQTEKVG